MKIYQMVISFNKYGLLSNISAKIRYLDDLLLK